MTNTPADIVRMGRCLNALDFYGSIIAVSSFLDLADSTPTLEDE